MICPDQLQAPSYYSPGFAKSALLNNGLKTLLEMDMFGSRVTHQLPQCFSWRPDPALEATDAFSQD